jgi:hypothetical protein
MLRCSMIAVVIAGPIKNDRSLLIEAVLGGRLGLQFASSSRIMLDLGRVVLDTKLDKTAGKDSIHQSLGMATKGRMLPIGYLRMPRSKVRNLSKEVVLLAVHVL